MNKPDRQQNEWLLHRRDSLKKRRERSQRHRTHRNRFPVAPLLVNQFNREQKQPKNRKVRIELPERLDLELNYEETITHLSNVRSVGQRKIRQAYLNFDRISYISPSAALLLASEVDQWNEAVGGRLRARHSGWHIEVKRLLCQLGFFDLLNLQTPADVGPVINTTFLPFIRGVVGNRSTAGQLAKQLRQQIEQVAGTDIKKHLLFGGLTEAITNVSQHAYSDSVKPNLQRWWMSAAYQRDTNTVVVSFCDHGLTIPGTLPSSKIFERIKEGFGTWNDGEKIRAAMEFGRTSTGELGRGRGLQNFLDIVKEHTGSRLHIYSKAGIMRATYSRDAGFAFTAEAVQTSLHGTLIEWQFVP